MTTRRVTDDEILAAFDALADLYAHVPPLIMWRAWELAVYRHHRLEEPVLDLGCGDGRFFRRAFPDVRAVVGVDQEEGLVPFAEASGAYERVIVAPAHQLPVADGSVRTVFANCSLEHMDHLPAVLREARRVLAPGGSVLASVVTDQFVEMGPLRALLAVCGASALGDAQQQAHEAYHHIVNALTVPDWLGVFERAGFVALESTPLMPSPTGWVFLLLDQLWHARTADGEFGTIFSEALRRTPDYAAGTRLMLEGLLRMSHGDVPYAGVVLRLHRA